MKSNLRGLYAITPETTDTTSLLAQVERALAGGAQLIQYRNKSTDFSLKLEQAGLLHSCCLDYRVPLIVNDDLALMQAIDAEGLHLGQSDGSISEARQQLAPNKILGVSCYNQLDLAQHAQQQGANYVAFGSFFPSTTKPQAVTASLTLLSEARRQIKIPIVAIGGITLSNAPSLIEAGAGMIALITALFDSPRIQETARAFTQLFTDKA